MWGWEDESNSMAIYHIGLLRSIWHACRFMRLRLCRLPLLNCHHIQLLLAPLQPGAPTTEQFAPRQTS